MISYGVVMLIAFIVTVFLFKIIAKLLYSIFFGKELEEYVRDISWSLLKDIAYLLLSYTLFFGLHYFHKLDFIKANIDSILYAILIFTSLWLFLGQIAIQRSFRFIR